MPGPVSHLSAPDRRRLLRELNYLNLEEVRAFCRARSIPYTIWIETPDGDRKRTRDTDRKSVVLERIRRYLTTGQIPDPTCFVTEIVCLEGPPRTLRPTDRLYYGWYDKKNPQMIELLRSLTNGKFRNGAIARILAREFWTRGEAPTFDEYAAAWLKAQEAGLGFHPEAAWLTDRASGEAGPDWKAKRRRIAARVLTVLDQLAPAKPVAK